MSSNKPGFSGDDGLAPIVQGRYERIKAAKKTREALLLWNH